MFDHHPAPSGPNPELQCLPFLLAGGQGSRLHELTASECKPAIPFAGVGRIVDFSVAAAHRAGFSRLMIATQYRPRTLARHLRDVWAESFASGIAIRDGMALRGGAEGYRGTADAIAANIEEIDRIAPREILVLAGDHVFDMDLQAMLATHHAAGAKATVAVTTASLREASSFGVLTADRTGRATAFAEKPAHPTPTLLDPSRALVSMGIYVFEWAWLREALIADARDPLSSHDFGHDILPRALREGVLHTHALPKCEDGAPGYWRDVGTLDAYRLAQLDFMGKDAPIRRPELPRDPANIARLAAGGRRSRLSGTIVLPGGWVGRDSRLHDVIVGPGVVLPAGTVIGEDAEEDARWFRRTRAGTVLVTQEMMEHRDATRIRPFALSGRTPILPLGAGRRHAEGQTAPRLI